MITAEDNELLTRVGPGTPCGELFRRYWHPVGVLPDLTDATPTKFVRILGEDLVLFRDKSSRVGLLADHCSHRGASLLYGRVEERGIACAYHGWLYDTEGNCLETPAEPADSLLHLTVKHRAYPVREQYGLYWAYMGPQPAPALPRYDFAEMGPISSVGLSWRPDCNWLQVVENNLDQSHVFILHQDTGEWGAAQRGTAMRSTAPEGGADSNSTRGLIDRLQEIEYSEVPFGIKRQQIHQDGYGDTDLLVFPASLRIYNSVAIRVPIDDTHTNYYHVNAALPVGSMGGRAGNGSTGAIQYIQNPGTGKSPSDAVHPLAQYRMDQRMFQDLMAIETQGPLAARENMHLATADQGVALLHTILKREIEKVQQGLDPIGVIRDPDHDLIDTYIQVYMDMVRKFPAERAQAR